MTLGGLEMSRTTMKLRRFSHLITWLALTTLPMQASIIPSRWEKVDALKPGSKIVVQLKSQDRIDGTLMETNQEALTLTSEDGSPREIPKLAVQTVTQERPSNRSTWIGTGIGGAAGAGIGAGLSGGFDETFLARTDLMALTFGAVGALAGALVGRTLSKPQQEVLYP